jgi:hypothetical protein
MANADPNLTIESREVPANEYLVSCLEIVEGRRNVHIIGNDLTPEILREYAIEALIRGVFETAYIGEGKLYFLEDGAFLSPQTYAEILNTMSADPIHWDLMDGFIQYVANIDDFPLFETLVHLDKDQTQINDYGTFSGIVYQSLFRAIYLGHETELDRGSLQRLWVKGAKAYQTLQFAIEGDGRYERRWSSDLRFGDPTEIFDTAQAAQFFRVFTSPELIPEEIGFLYKEFPSLDLRLENPQLLDSIGDQFSELLYLQLIPQVLKLLKHLPTTDADIVDYSIKRRYLEIITAMWNHYYTGEEHVNSWNSDVAKFSRGLGQIIAYRQYILRSEFESSLINGIE